MINIVELDERINKCLSILQDNPRSRIFAALAEAYRRRGEVGRAFSICKNGLRVHPDYGAAHVVMAKLYLHQNMVEQACASIDRAVELDGQSRSTDLVLAEIYLEAGDYKNVRELLSRLDRAGSADPAVESLRRRLSQSIKGSKSGSVSTAATPNFLPASESAYGSPPPEPSVSSAQMVCHDPVEAVSMVLEVPQTMICAIWDDDGTRLAMRAKAGHDPEPIADEAWELFKDVERQLVARGWGRLSTMRIEEPQGLWGFLKQDSMIALIVGVPRMRYAAAVRKVAECLDQIAVSDTVPDGDQTVRPAVTEGAPD